MFTKSVSLFLFLLAVLQVSARYKAEEPTNIDNEINPGASSSLRIGSGWEAQPGQFPYHAALRTVNPQGSIWRCGGAIVAHDWVITAGQCTRSLGSVSVRVGLSFNRPDAIYPGEKWYSHPEFNDLAWGDHLNDIALVKTQRPIVFTNLVKPIRLQRSADAYRNYDGEQVFISGHGRTGHQATGVIPDMLRWVYLQAISNSECARTITTGLVVDTIICARYFNDTTQSPCHGDGGGPLMHIGSDGVPTLIGVWSFMWGATACLSGMPTGYTRPGPYLPWFKEVTGIDFDTIQEEEDTTTTTPTTTTPTTTTTTTPIPTTTTPTTTTTTTPIPTTTTTTTPTPTTTTPTTTTTTTPTPTTTTPTTTTTTTPTPTTTTPTTTTTTTPIPTTTTPTTTTTTTPITTTTTTGDPTTITTTAPTTEAEEQTPDGTTPEEDTTASTEDSGEGDDSDGSESDKDDDDMTQLLKRLQVLVKVKVRMDKYNAKKAVGMDIDHHKQ